MFAPAIRSQDSAGGSSTTHWWIPHGPNEGIPTVVPRSFIMPDAFNLKQFIVQPVPPNTEYDRPDASDLIQLFVTPKGGSQEFLGELKYKRLSGGGFIGYQASRGDVLDINKTYSEGAVVVLVFIKTAGVNPAGDEYSASLTGVWLRE